MGGGITEAMEVNHELLGRGPSGNVNAVVTIILVGMVRNHISLLGTSLDQIHSPSVLEYWPMCFPPLQSPSILPISQSNRERSFFSQKGWQVIFQRGMF